MNNKANTNHNQASDTITTMKGYTKGSSSSSISTSDTLNTAIGKLENGKVSKKSQSINISTGNNSNVVKDTSFGGATIGYELTNNYSLCCVIGSKNKEKNFSSTGYKYGDIFVIGGSTDRVTPKDVFRVTTDGYVYASGSYNSYGADFAEYFEWEDGNPDNEDRIGYFVTLDGNKIRIANDEDDYILGIISGTACLMGNAQDDDWKGKYIYDKWGRAEYEDVIVPTEYINRINEKTGEEEKVLVIEEHIVSTMKLNPDFDSNVDYTPRSQRKEWTVVGMLGQIFVRDDGTCGVNGYCKCKDGGIATKSDTKENAYRVMKRVDENTIQVLFR